MVDKNHAENCHKDYLPDANLWVLSDALAISL